MFWRVSSVTLEILAMRSLASTVSTITPSFPKAKGTLWTVAFASLLCLGVACSEVPSMVPLRKRGIDF